MPATCHQLPYERNIDLIAAEGPRVLDALEGADISAQVPTCPEWNVAKLVDHLGAIHRWAARIVELLSQERVRGRDVPDAQPASDDERARWFGDGIELLATTLKGADPDAPVWAWGADQHVAFWARRQLHETTIHRADLEITVGREPTIDTEIAVDGIDEFLDNLDHAASFAPNVNQLRGEGERICLAATDAGVAWTIDLLEDRFGWRHSDEQSGVRVEGPAGDLVLFVYGRVAPGEAVAVTGDADLLERWRKNSSI
ncbi:MAG TPA: maleylpyruvate isomerase family mycothiol-dependent enzyme [Actinomycetota bacterium]|nr:maleylpyruvate isomerase family mycothiol-dependent enzyme [Actinomycetota bacterium]